MSQKAPPLPDWYRRLTRGPKPLPPLAVAIAMTSPIAVLADEPAPSLVTLDLNPAAHAMGLTGLKVVLTPEQARKLAAAIAACLRGPPDA